MSATTAKIQNTSKDLELCVISLKKKKWYQGWFYSVSMLYGVLYLSLIKLDQSRPGSMATVVQDQVRQDGQTLLIRIIV